MDELLFLTADLRIDLEVVEVIGPIVPRQRSVQGEEECTVYELIRDLLIHFPPSHHV